MNIIYGWKKGQTWMGGFIRCIPIAAACALLGTFLTDTMTKHTKIDEIWSFLGWAGIGNVEMITMASCGSFNFVLTKMMLALSSPKEKSE